MVEIKTIVKKKAKLFLVLLSLLLILLLLIKARLNSNFANRNWQINNENKFSWYNVVGANYKPLMGINNKGYFHDEKGFTYKIDLPSGRVDWSFRDNQYAIHPVFVSGALVYLTSFDGRLYALDNKTGKEKWRFTVPDLIKADTEPIVSGGLVYFGSRNGKLYAVKEGSGDLVWEFATRGIDNNHLDLNKPIIHFGQFIVDKNNVYINSSSDNVIYALSKDSGRKVWQYTDYKYTHRKPMMEDNAIGVESEEDKFVVLNKSNGQVIWQKKIVDRQQQDYVLKDGFIYYRGGNNNLEKYDISSGKLLWTYHDDEFIQELASFAEFGSGIVLYSTISPGQAGKLVCLDEDSGERKWSINVSSQIRAKPFISEGIIYFAVGNTVYIFSTEGKILKNSMTIGENNLLLLADNYLYMINKYGKDDAVIYCFSKSDLNQKWSYLATNIDLNSIQTVDGDIYFLNNSNVLFKLSSRLGKTTNFKNIKLPALSSPPNYFSQLWNKIFQSNNFQIETTQRQITRGDVYELTLKFEQNNCKFISPSGEKYVVHSFYYDKNTWKIRFLPHEVGEWQWEIGSRRGKFLVTESSWTGFIKFNQANPPQLIFENGATFTAVGIQDCFRDINHTGDTLNQLQIGETASPEKNLNYSKLAGLNKYLDIYANKETGFNLFRVNVNNCSDPLWREISKNGNQYDINQGIREDKLLQELKNRSIRIWISLFSFKLPLEGNISEPTYQKAITGYLDYVIARFAPYVDIWELANETTLDNDWLNFVSSYLKNNDIYKHPIAVSWERPDIQNIDISSLHWYDSEYANESDLVTVNKIEQAKIWGKPIVFSEVGNKFSNWDLDSALRMRARMWVSYFNNSTLIFWNTSGSYFDSKTGNSNIYLGPVERQEIKIFRELTKGFDKELTSIKIKTNNKVRSYGFQSDRGTLLYFFNGDKRLSDVSFELNLPQMGLAQWINPQNGNTISVKELPKGTQTMRSPLIENDLLLKVEFKD